MSLRLARLNQLLGTELTLDETQGILTRLGMEVTVDNETFQVLAPSARRDIEIEADLIEEVARVYGYDKLPKPPSGRWIDRSCPGRGRVARTAAAPAAQRPRFSGNHDLEFRRRE